jgi:uncharacterized OsmC-like protein
MKEEIKIIYQHYIPDKLIADFEKLGVDNQLQVEIKKEKEEQKYYNFTGSVIADIVIYVQQHTTELIASGLLVNLAYDTFKGGLKLLWTGISKLAIKKLQSKGKESDKPKSISLRLMDKDRAIEVVLNGDVDEKQADKVIDEAIKFISSEKLNEAFKNPDFIPEQTEKPRIRLKFNKEKQVWEPENFGEYRRQIEAYQKWAEENFDS